MIAHEDDIVTCERGHPLYRITRGFSVGMLVRSDNFESINPRVAAPAPFSPIKKTCPRCGRPWVIESRAGRIGHIHFEDGWRPRLPESRPTTERAHVSTSP